MFFIVEFSNSYDGQLPGGSQFPPRHGLLFGPKEFLKANKGGIHFPKLRVLSKAMVLHVYGQSSCFMGKSAISIARFNSYVSLAEG